MTKADELQERVERFADAVIALVQGLPDGLTPRRLGGQLLDAGTSVAANYRAARKGKSYADFTAKVGTVSEEADEAVYWLTRLRNAGIHAAQPLEPLLAEAVELSRIFSAMARTTRRRRGRQRPEAAR
jgi:four helix bundle protein